MRADTKKRNTKSKVAEVREEREQRLERLNIAPVGHNRAKNLFRLLVTESVNVVDALFSS